MLPFEQISRQAMANTLSHHNIGIKLNTNKIKDGHNLQEWERMHFATLTKYECEPI